MKLPDTEHLHPEQYLQLADTWRQDWERGVQVPVGLEAIPPISCRYVLRKILFMVPLQIYSPFDEKKLMFIVMSATCCML